MGIQLRAADTELWEMLNSYGARVLLRDRHGRPTSGGDTCPHDAGAGRRGDPAADPGKRMLPTMSAAATRQVTDDLLGAPAIATRTCVVTASLSLYVDPGSAGRPHDPFQAP